MSQANAPVTNFASGRYSKRKRTQVNYRMEELDVDDTERESEDDFAQPKRQRKTKQHKTARPKPLPKRKIFPFLELPAEIRNIIYSYALMDPSGLNFVAVQRNKRRCVERVSRQLFDRVSSSMSCYQSNRINDDVRDGDNHPAILVPSLLAVNKQIHREGRDFLYGNDFVFADTLALYAFMINIGPASASSLKRMHLLGWGRNRTMKAYNNACFSVLIWASGLEKFCIKTTLGWRDEAASAARQLYRDAFPWLEAVGNAKGRFDAAIDILEMDGVSIGFYDRSTRSQQELEKAELAKFNAELRRHLASQQKRIMDKSTRRKKISKVSD